MSKIVAIGCDHAGYPYKKVIIELLKSKGFTVSDKGAYSLDSVDYPDHVHPVAQEVSSATATCGIIMCGSGNGAAMTANKHQDIRAALCWTKELSSLARQHNNANILAIPVRFVSETTALEMVEAFLSTDFEGGRHQRRVGKIKC
ncbi:MAG: ribose 5-phosphate isomerase B [Saprospiraceae bacterium]|nr:ribose 5-phosphate isomerase B [Saprospiraceae bacterium]